MTKIRRNLNGVFNNFKLALLHFCNFCFKFVIEKKIAQ